VVKSCLCCWEPGPVPIPPRRGYRTILCASSPISTTLVRSRQARDGKDVMIPIHGFCRKWHVLDMPDKDRGARTAEPRPLSSRPWPTRGVARGIRCVAAAADYNKTHAESQSGLMQARMPIFDSAPPPQGRTMLDQVGPGLPIARASKVTCQEALPPGTTRREAAGPETRTAMRRRATSSLRKLSSYLARHIHSPPQPYQRPHFHERARVIASASRHFTSSGPARSSTSGCHSTPPSSPRYMSQPRRQQRSPRSESGRHAALQSSALSTHTSANARHRPLGPDDAHGEENPINGPQPSSMANLNEVRTRGFSLTAKSKFRDRVPVK